MTNNYLATHSLLPSLFDSKGFERFFEDTAWIDGTKGTYPCNIYYNESTKNTVLEYALAGFSKDEIKISVVNDKLTIETVTSIADNSEIKYYKQGIAKRNMKVTWQLSATIDKKNINTTFKDGLLTIVLPKIAEEVLTITVG